ncbi:tRNA uridine-5-carboxymethylaminomethyl(34) synthesis enzyme MnmG [Sphingomonas aracearum]|uniref:tRNA uridine 5-carboxymethylaminomethyl modification enzyme MnmG n=1 Tax=Sphingomonas aracearum TaxID=2283317 RepID=A0A369VRE3_9SPHN|nr:tRNA uridine-5-carboxymethylaminomethyl(34) synthesis enzyme MnmG [Sphingomonas aracearum]RDE04593.1 tRNA uridine-5-carboxymethylaminomethyl(34) synthesis enzyme MnmG [Sphingomonas aracearum]
MTFDVVVIGGGHAGTEAAAAAARRGARTALVSFDAARIGEMSCNPAIGGVGKGHLVREVDAFDGLIGRAADAAAIHHRMLNRSKGVAVHGPRVQADRVLYKAAIQESLRRQNNLTVVAGEAYELLLHPGSVAGVVLDDGTKLRATAVVLATGTFLGGRLFRGEERLTGGRIGEAASVPLAAQIRSLGLPMGRLKTGTPPRLDGRTIDWARLERQESDVEPWFMSPMTRTRRLPQLHCAVSRTTAQTHEIIRSGLDRSPLFGGDIQGSGPRYCPSIEDKVFRFADRDSHQVFLEPEGLDTHLIYPNGISTSLPTDVQAAMIASMPGLEHAVITEPGYAVEYDYLDPRALSSQLALAAIPGLFCAGQINGTTGYEEAAAQGLIAGLNAAAHALGVDAVVLDRASSYLGVMVDDLVLQGVTEPYRMLTARAEYRLRLRADNAETRLGPIAAAAGCLSPERSEHQARREQQRQQATRRLDDLQAGPPHLGLPERRSAAAWLRVDGVTLADVAPDLLGTGDADVLAEVVEDARYAPYLERQAREIAELRENDAIRLPDAFKFGAVPGLSNEMIERLTRASPQTLGEAGRIRGVTAAALSAILLQARRLAR